MKKLRRIFLARAATMLALAVLTTTGAWAQETKVSTTYIDANNQSQTVDAYPLNGTEEILGVEGSETPVAYVANSDINFNRGLSLACDVIFIIGDGKTVNFGTSNENRISSNAFAGQNYNLGIYCQSRLVLGCRERTGLHIASPQGMAHPARQRGRPLPRTARV